MTLSIDNQARIKKLENLFTMLKAKTEKTIISESEPENPTIGTAWFDTTELSFKTWEGNRWSEATTVNSLAIGSSPDWFRVDGDGNMWSGRSDLSTAQSETFAVLNTGVLYAKNAVISGDITITGGNTNLDAINDGSTYKRVTSSEKTGAGRGYNAINSNNRYQNWLSADDMNSASLPTNGVVFGSQGIVGRKSGVTTFELNTSGDALFRGTIYATGGEIEGLLDITGSGSIRTGTLDDGVIIGGETIYLRNTVGGNTTINWIKAIDEGIQLAGDIVCTGGAKIGGALDMDNNPITNSGNIILPSGKYFAVQTGSGLILDGTFHKIYYKASTSSWWATDDNGTFELYSTGGGGGGWVGNATTDLDMNGYNIYDTDNITTNSGGTVVLNGKLRIPVGTNLY